jgi:glutaredoxin 2
MIELYMRDGCPFCQKVVQAAGEFGFKEEDFTVIDAAPETPGREVLLNRGGKPMVPFLIDGDTCMYESGDIITYLKNYPRT